MHFSRQLKDKIDFDACLQLNNYLLLLSAKIAMLSMPVVLTEWKNYLDSQNQ